MIKVTQDDLDAAKEMWMLSLNYGSKIGMAEVCCKYREKAADNERAKIVAWLRLKQFLIPDHLGDTVADYIEAGEHLK
jgi:hypothetical protein